MKYAKAGSVARDRNGQLYVAAFRIDDGKITVSSKTCGSKTRQVGDWPDTPGALALVLLGELITEHLAGKTSCA